VSHTEVQSTAVVTENRLRTEAPFGLAELGGYRLEERIGLGGFGEVWRGIGPGGFAKAIKILFGSLSGPQAETELKALNRIRDLRHPFLLNIERIEVIDGRVVVVSELADRSLEARFKEVVESGQRGIAREELLGYLRDAADALDFMSEQHGLQHLDIKPENLLLQGSHAKVGDFGLTKSLSAAGHSQVNGFTPLYAPPELFDGRPERGSDQYSLAVVYQTMLTGVPPFNGRSAAQLTSQHLKSAPDLSPLHNSDRPVVARALSKNPRTRFPSCRQFIDELSKRRYASSSLPRAAGAAEPGRTASLTEFVEAGTAGLRKSQLLPPVTPLPPESTEGLSWFLRPTVFVGLGGLGTQVVVRLRERCQQLFPTASLPLLQFVCIDSDSESIEAIRHESPEGSTISMTSVAIPLRSSHEYRKVSSEHLNWLSRRWLFNIPRSGNVEAMRPLGRLAFVDHFNTIRGRLQNALDMACSPDAVNRTQQQTQLPCSLDGIDFVLVGATSGGTSSGSMLDAAWLAKSLVDEKRLPHCTVSAVLLHGTCHGRQAADMQDANTISFLKELHYFSLPGVQRPGTSSRSSHSSDSAMPLDNAWLLHLGDDLTSAGFTTGLNAVTDYLELRTLTPARKDMDAWRQHESQSPNSGRELPLRTFGIARVASDAWEVAKSEASQLAVALVDSWLFQKGAHESFGSFSQLPADLSALITELALTSEGVIQMVPRLLNGERTRRVDEYACNLWTRLSQSAGAISPADLAADLIAHDAAASPQQKNPIASIPDDVRRDLVAGAAVSISRIERYLLLCSQGPTCVASAEQASKAIARAINVAIAANAGQKSDLQQAFRDLCSAHRASDNGHPRLIDANSLKSFCRQYCMLLVCQAVCECVSAHLTQLSDAAMKLHDSQVAPLKQRLADLVSLLRTSADHSACVPEAIVKAFGESMLRGGRFRPSLFLKRDPSASDAQLLTTEATNFLFRHAGSDSRQGPGTPADVSADFLGSARPHLRHVGGGQRVLAAVPEQVATDHWKTLLQNEFDRCVSVCQMKREDISVLCEVEGISISTVVESLSHLKPGVVELSNRIHSRNDIPW